MEVKHINSLPGQPSTFWSVDGEHWYRNKKEAEANDISKSVNPDDYVYSKGFFAANWQWLIPCILFVALCAGGFYLWHKGAITFHIHKAA